MASFANDRLDSVVDRMTALNFSEEPLPAVQPQKTSDVSGSSAPGADLDKKIRAIKKKVPVFLALSLSKNVRGGELLSIYIYTTHAAI